MNPVSTVGDLVRALSAYPTHLPLQVLLEGRALRLATDLQIMRRCDMPAEGVDVVQIVLQDDSPRRPLGRTDERLDVPPRTS